MKFLIIALAITLVTSRYGGDISAQVSSVENIKCLKKLGVDFLIYRAYRSYGKVDPNVVSNIKHTIAGGITDVGVYIFPCFKCGNPKKQIEDTVKALAGLPYNMIWIDIEGSAKYWGKIEANRKFIKEMLDAASAQPKPIGIYTSRHSWREIVGENWTEGSKYALWWPHWDNKQDFNNFPKFGGWTKPAIKQFKNDRKACSVT